MQLVALSALELLEWNKQQLLSLLWYTYARVYHFCFQHVVFLLAVYQGWNVDAVDWIIQVDGTLDWLKFDYDDDISFQSIEFDRVLQYIEQDQLIALPISDHLEIQVRLLDQVQVHMIDLHNVMKWFHNVFELADYIFLLLLLYYQFILFYFHSVYLVGIMIKHRFWLLLYIRNIL